MATISETGHAKNIANFETLITRCAGYSAAYNPSNPLLNIVALQLLHTESKAELNQVSIAKAPYDQVEGQRKTIFKPYSQLATQIMASLQSSGAPETVISDGKTIYRKMQGRRAPGTKAQPIEGATPIDRISVSQQSYDMKIEHLSKMIEHLSVEMAYMPNEEKLKIQSLKNYKDELELINTGVKIAYVPYSQAMAVRNRKLYASETGLVARAQLVKNYVKSIYSTKSPEYKMISKLMFRSTVEIE